MAKNQETEFVQVPKSEWDRLQASIAELLHDKRVREEKGEDFYARSVIDRKQEERENALLRPVPIRTQEAADRLFPDGQRFQVVMDSTKEDGKPGPDVSFCYPLEINANSDLEAQARYQLVMGITSHKYRLRAAPVPAAA